MAFEYNTTEEKLKFPAYGRLVQEMIKQAIEEPNRQRRQAMAEHIVTVMADVNPQMQESPNYQEILWNHLAFIAEYKLDIDYPCEIEHADKNTPRKLSYPGNKIRYRHYGHLIEETISKIKDIPQTSPERSKQIRAIASRMKRCLIDWKGDDVENEKISHDIALYTDNIITAEDVLEMLKESNQLSSQSNRQNNYSNKRGLKFYNKR